MTVPFSPEELVARVWAIMRRTYGPTATLTPLFASENSRSTSCGAALPLAGMSYG